MWIIQSLFIYLLSVALENVKEKKTQFRKKM